MKVLITGSNGFIGKNLLTRLSEFKDVEILTFVHSDPIEGLFDKVKASDFIFHLAGVNRPQTESEFIEGNSDLTLLLCNCIRKSGKNIPIVYTSSIQAELDNPYGKSKLLGESHLQKLGAETENSVYIYRLPNVFGKWCRPNYNSVVATFCHNILHGMPIQINDSNSVINLVYIDDLILGFLRLMRGADFRNIEPIYQITVGELKDQIMAFKESKKSLISERVGTGLVRALYSTYISYYNPSQFTYLLPKHDDPRGSFVEMIKTKDSGQFSFFTAHKGITRGGHYHHSKNEKFLVVKGESRFCFRHILTDEKFELFTSGSKPEVVETIPGWTHDITNMGQDEMIVIIWANEIFDRDNPDTVASNI